MNPETIVTRYLTASTTVEVKGAVMVGSPDFARIQRTKGEKLLEEILGETEATRYIENRRGRDGQKAHLTLMDPKETKEVLGFLADEAIQRSPGLSKGKAQEEAKRTLVERLEGMNLSGWNPKGLGIAEKDGHTAYFMVIEWPEGQEARKSLGLKHHKDFHITVGFDPVDVHGVPKNTVIRV